MTTLLPDPWQALSVDKTADKPEVRTAYKKLVLKYHPDKVQDPTLKAKAQDEFHKIQQAYELLNDDNERAKYEEQLKLHELRKQAAMMSKNMPNSSASRSKYSTYEIRTAEHPSTRYKTSTSTSEKTKVYSNHGPARSHEEMPSSRVHTVYEEPEKFAKRAASYEKPSKREEERREKDEKERERRKKREKEFEEDVRLRGEKERERDRGRENRDRERDRDRGTDSAPDRERERSKEKDREKDKSRERAAKDQEKAERKKDRDDSDKKRDRDRRRDTQDKSRRNATPYIEEVGGHDEAHAASKPEKKRSSSKRHGEAKDRTKERDRERERERDQSVPRREPSPPRVEAPQQSPEKHAQYLDFAASYILKSRGDAAPPAFSAAQTDTFFTPPVAPTPPPADLVDDSVRRSAARAATRRVSHDAPRSKEHLPSSFKSTHYDYPEVIDATPTKARPIPQSHKSTPVVDPPRGLGRSNTAPAHELYGTSPISIPTRHPPSLGRMNTWTSGSEEQRYRPEYYNDSDDDHERERRSHRSNRRSQRSPEPIHRYKVSSDKIRTSKMETGYSYGESPTSTRRYHIPAEGMEGRSPKYSGFRVKESQSYGVEDVAFAEFNKVQYSNVPEYGPVYT